MLDQMRIFAAVVETGSFSAAAKKLGISKALASRQVSQLESELGAKLLNRTTRKLSLTEIGSFVYPHCSKINHEADEVRQIASGLNSQPSGVLRISSPLAFGSLHVAPALPSLLEKYPELEIDLVLTDQAVDLVEDNIDVALHLFNIPSELVVARRLAPLNWILCASEEYLQRHGEPATPSELTRHNCLIYPELHRQSEWHFRSAKGEIVVQVHGNCRANGTPALLRMVREGMGIALLPSFVAGSDVAEGRVVPVLQEYEPMLYSTLYALHLPNRYLPPKINAFINHLTELYGAVPYWDRAISGYLRGR